MTLQQEIDNLTWHNAIVKLKSILKKLLPSQPVDSRPYKVYTALLTQTDTEAPVATVLENTFEDTPTFEYISLGTYLIKSKDLQKNKNKVTFQVNQSHHLAGNIHFVNEYVTIFKNLSGDIVTNLTLQHLEYRMLASNGSFANYAKINNINEVQNLMIEIRVYN